MLRRLKKFSLWVKKVYRRAASYIKGLFVKPKKIGSVVLSGGQKLYELEVKTGKLKEFDIKEAVVDQRTGDKVLRVEFRKDCDYFKSYSCKAANKKARKRYLEGKY